MLSRIKKLSRTKKSLLLTVFLLMIPICYLGYIGIQNDLKWSSSEAEVSRMGGHLMIGKLRPEGYKQGPIASSRIFQKMMNYSFPILKPFLTRFGISCYSETLSDDYVQKLPESDEFTCIIMSSKNITDEAIKKFLKFPNLEILVLHDCNITDKNIHLLTQFQKLRRINLKGTQITDSAVEEIAKLPNITRLDLSQTAITDKSIPQLMKMKSLKWFSYTGTKITDKGIQELKSELPKLNTYHK